MCPEHHNEQNADKEAQRRPTIQRLLKNMLQGIESDDQYYQADCQENDIDQMKPTTISMEPRLTGAELSGRESNRRDHNQNDASDH